MIKPLPHHHRHYIKKTLCRKNQGSKHASRAHFTLGRIVLESSSCAVGAQHVEHLGFGPCLLPSSMVVLQSCVPYFQGPPGSPQWVGLTSGSSGHHCWFHLREYNYGELSGHLMKCDQRLERFQEISHQGGHVPICLHHVRQDFDRIEKSHTRHSV